MLTRALGPDRGARGSRRPRRRPTRLDRLHLAVVHDHPEDDQRQPERDRQHGVELQAERRAADELAHEHEQPDHEQPDLDDGVHDHAHRAVAVAAPRVAQRDVVLGHVPEQRDEHERRERGRDADRLGRGLEARHEPLRGERGHRARRRRGYTSPARNGRSPGFAVSSCGPCGARSSVRMKTTPTTISAMPAASEMPWRSPFPSRSLGTLRIAIGRNAMTLSVVMPENRRRSKRSDAPRPPRTSGMQARDAAQQHRVAQERAHDRELDDLGEVRAQREDRDRELRDVAEAGLDDADDARREPAAQGVGALRDDRRDEQERRAGGDRARRVAHDRVKDARDSRQRDAGDQDRVAADHFSPESVASSASAIAFMG